MIAFVFLRLLHPEGRVFKPNSNNYELKYLDIYIQ